MKLETYFNQSVSLVALDFASLIRENILSYDSCEIRLAQIRAKMRQVIILIIH